MTTGSEFRQWIERELEQRGSNMAALARRCGITDSQVSRILNGDQQPDTATLRTLATALEIPLYEVYVRAGLLPVESDRSVVIDRILELLKTLPEVDQQALLDMTRVRVERAKRQIRGRNNRM
jgi:transcriptional regulator with XRE-family HTH domain